MLYTAISLSHLTILYPSSNRCKRRTCRLQQYYLGNTKMGTAVHQDLRSRQDRVDLPLPAPPCKVQLLTLETVQATTGELCKGGKRKVNCLGCQGWWNNTEGGHFTTTTTTQLKKATCSQQFPTPSLAVEGSPGECEPKPGEPGSPRERLVGNSLTPSRGQSCLCLAPGEMLSLPSGSETLFLTERHLVTSEHSH